MVAALVALGVVFAVRGDLGGDSGGSEEQLMVRGSLTIIGGGGYVKRTPCHGTSGGGDSLGLVDPFDYSDYEGGAPVRVLSADGTVLGSSNLSPGEYVTGQPFSGSDGCRFEFAVPLDTGSTRYQLVVASSSPLDFTDASEDLDLAIGP